MTNMANMANLVQIKNPRIKVSTKPPIVFSTSVKNQIIGTDLVFGLFYPMKGDMSYSKNSRKCIKRIENRLNNIKKTLYEGDLLVLNPRDHKKYNTIIDKVQNIIIGMDLDLDYFNAVLMVVEDIRESAKNSNNKALYNDWTLLSQSLNTLYKHLDPNLTKDKFMKLGKNLANRIYKTYKS
jgi:hypothetical protein